MLNNIISGNYIEFHKVRDASSDIEEKFQALFPTWPTIIATIIALLTLLLVLTKLLYEPVKKMHNDRKKYIQENIDTAEQQNFVATKDREKANNELIEARLKAQEIIEKAKTDALTVRDKRLHMADLEAKKILNDAKNDIASQQTKFEEESEKAIVEVALSAASKILEKEVDSKSSEKIIKNFIKSKK